MNTDLTYNGENKNRDKTFMSDDSYLLDSNDKKEKSASRWFGRLLKISFIICAFVLVILTVLANMGGTSEMLRGGVIQTISNMFGGRPVKMGKLNNMSFFPTVALDIEQVGVYEQEGDIVPLVRLKALQVYMPFWNVATKSPRLTRFYVEGFEAIRGIFMPAHLLVEKIFIDHDVENGKAILKGNGKIGVHLWNLNVDLDAKGSNGKYSYMVAPNSRIVFDVADLHFEGTLIRGKDNYVKISDFNAVFGEIRVGGDLTLSALSEKLLKLKGTIKTKDDRTILSPDLIIDFSKQTHMDISGSVLSDKIVIGDLVGENSVFMVFSRFRDIIGHGAIPRRKDGTLALLGSNDMNIDFNLNNVNIDGQIKKNLKFNMVQDEGRIKIGPVFDPEGMVMPVIMALYNKDENTLISIIQDGRFDIKFIRSWIKNLPKHILNSENIDVECGIARFTEKKGGMEIESFGINTKSRNISVKEKTIPYNTRFSDLNFVDSKGRAKLETVSLPNHLYEFAQGSLTKSQSGSPCSSYVELHMNEPQKPEQDIQQ